jgi:hypothetical protein
MDEINEQPEKVDELLAAWSQHHAPSALQLANLQARILAESAASSGKVARPARGWRLSRQVLPFAAALVCCALAVTLVLQFGGERPAPSAAPPAASQLPLEHLQTLLSEMDRLFDERLAWVAETNETIALGLDEKSFARGPHVVVRVVVLKRSPDANSWQPVWTGDVVSRSEERVQIRSASDASRLSLWTHVLPDGAVAVDTELGLESNGPVWNSSTVQQSLVPLQVLSARAQGGEFQIWQTAALLPEAEL